MDFLKNIDVYPSTLSFNMEKSQTFNTPLGGIFSLLLVILFIVLFMIFGLDLFNRTNPNINQQRLTLSSPQLYNFNPQEFKINFTFYGSNSQGFSKIPADYFIVNFTTIDENFSQTNVLFSKYYSDNKTTLTFTNTNSATFYDYFTSSETFRFIQFQVNLCTLESFAGCSLGFVKNITDKNDIFMSVSLMTNGVDISNPQIPLYTNSQNFLIKLNPQLSKNMFFTFKKVVVSNDLGWLFKQPKEFEGQDILNFLDDVNSINTDFDYGINLFNGIIIFGRTREIYSISYLKIQDLFAKVGGILNVFFLIFKIVSGFYSQHKVENYIIESFIKENLSEKQKRNLIKIDTLSYEEEVKEMPSDLKNNKSNEFKTLSFKEKIISNLCRNRINRIQLENFIKFTDYLEKTKQLLDISEYFELRKKVNYMNIVWKRSLNENGKQNSQINDEKNEEIKS